MLRNLFEKDNNKEELIVHFKILIKFFHSLFIG